jgi:two-component system cell cycle response regulator CtrA
MFRILLLEGDARTAERIVMLLRAAGHLCEATDLGGDGLGIASVYDYDILLLDLAGAAENARILRQLRIGRVHSPVLTLAALDDRLRALGVEAEECLAKPFTRRALLGRIEALAGAQQTPVLTAITTGMLTVNLDRGTAEVGGQRLRLTAKEYGILELLALRKGTTLTKEHLRRHLYSGGGSDEPELKIIDVFVCKLRKKLAEATGGENYIDTAWGRGYVLRDPAHPVTDGGSDVVKLGA